MQNNCSSYIVNYITGLNKYRFNIQNIKLTMDEEKLNFRNEKFNFSILFNKIATVEFVKSPFQMPYPLSPVNLNTSCCCFKIYYLENDIPKSVLFMMRSDTSNSLNNEEANKNLFYMLSNIMYSSHLIISPWGTNKYDSSLIKIKKTYTMSYLGGHPKNNHKFSKVDFHIMNDRFYISPYINENKFIPFEIPFEQITVFELVNHKNSSIARKFLSLCKITNVNDTVHIVFTDKNGIKVSTYLSMLLNNSIQDNVNGCIELFNYWQKQS